MTYFLLFLGGDAKLLVMLCVSPAQRFITETLQCLGFGSRARQVARGQTKKRRPTSFVPNSISLGLSVLCVCYTTCDQAALLPFSLAFAFSTLRPLPPFPPPSPPPKKKNERRSKRKGEREEEKKNTSSQVSETWNFTVNRQ